LFLFTEEPKPGPSDLDHVVRGRVKTETKSETFNQLWTTEEQKRYAQTFYLATT